MLVSPEKMPSQDRVEAIGQSEVELVNYVFHKILLTWGETKFWQQFSDEQTLSDVKRDHANDILEALGKRSGRESQDEFIFRLKSKVDTIFSEIRTVQDNQKRWEWPNLRNILSYMANYVSQPCHTPFAYDRALPNKSKIARDREAGRRELDRCKNLMGCS